jgi:hypothetical protein
MRRPRLVAVLLSFVVAGCGTSKPSSRPSAPRGGVFSYDASAPLRYVDRGRVNTRDSALAVHDVSFTSGGRHVDGYLVVPPGDADARPASN